MKCERMRGRVPYALGFGHGFGIVRRCMVNRVEYGKYPRAFELPYGVTVLELHASTTPYARDAYDEPTR